MVSFSYRAVERLPKQLERGVLYHSPEFEVAALSCACGCGHRVMLLVPDSRCRSRTVSRPYGRRSRSATRLASPTTSSRPARCSGSPRSRTPWPRRRCAGRSPAMSPARQSSRHGRAGSASSPQGHSDGSGRCCECDTVRHAIPGRVPARRPCSRRLQVLHQRCKLLLTGRSARGKFCRSRCYPVVLHHKNPAVRETTDFEGLFSY